MEVGLEGTADVLGNLPALVTALVGRGRELADADELVGASRLVTLTGPGGVGKTRLALEVATWAAGRFPDGVWFVELAPVGDPASVADAIATTLGVTPRAGVPMTEAVAEAVSERRLLIVLDNCEHVIDAAAEAVEAMLARGGSSAVLATSREGLRVAGEQLMPVSPLDLEGGTASPAVTLFVQRAREVDPRFEFDDASAAEAVFEICRGLDGLALAIELAAARMVSMTPVELQQRLLADRFRMLTGSSRQRTLHQSVGWSFDLLRDEERSVLHHASVFAGGFDLDAVTAVTGASDPIEVLDLLDSLARKSLVIADRSRGRTRYRLLETIRQFAENDLVALGELDVARDRHAAFFAAAATDRWEEWNGPGFHDSVRWASIELANLRAAFRWSAGRDVEIAADLAAHGAMIGVPAELFETLRWVEDILDPAIAADVRRLPRLLVAAGYRCFTGYPEEALVHAQTAVRLEKRPQYEPFESGLASFIEALAQVYAGHLDRYVEITRRVASLPDGPRAYGLPAFVDGLQATGLVDDALDLVDEAVAAARQSANPFWVAYALWIRGSVYARVDPRRAMEAWREALTYVEEHQVTFFTGFIARDAASLELRDADPDEALAMFDAAVDSFHQSGNIPQLTITLASLTLLFERIKRAEAAAVLYGATTCLPGSDRHVPALPGVAERLTATMDSSTLAVLVSSGATMNISAAAHYARQQIQLERAQLATRTTRPTNVGGLSRREAEVLELIGEGLTTREIAGRLFISPKTADHHIQHIYTKIGVSNRPGATLWALKHGVIDGTRHG